MKSRVDAFAGIALFQFLEELLIVADVKTRLRRFHCELHKIPGGPACKLVESKLTTVCPYKDLSQLGLKDDNEMAKLMQDGCQVVAEINKIDFSPQTIEETRRSRGQI